MGNNMYKLEQNLVDDFVIAIKSYQQWRNEATKIVTEFDYSRGRTDVVTVNSQNKVFAFEAKLDKWRDAVHQAYRNTCFAHFSYIVLPTATANIALKHVDWFHKLSIGLCTLTMEKELEILIPAQYNTPLQKWLTERVLKTASESKEYASV